ncbi:MAG: ABC transporter substrate-binding protein, partial [Betaproteobacteria bacterium]
MTLPPLRSLFSAIALLAIGALATAPCTAMAQGTIRIGAPLPLTGPLSPEAQKLQNGMNLWVETANKAGGIKVGAKKMKVEIVYVDYQSNTPRAVQATEKLITQDKVDFLFSPFGSGAAKAASSVSEKYEMPTIAATASSEQVYDQGYKYLFGVYTP